MEISSNRVLAIQIVYQQSLSVPICRHAEALDQIVTQLNVPKRVWKNQPGYASSLSTLYNKAMTDEREFDVVIAGGGMVGVSLARLLSDLGSSPRPRKIALIDRIAFDPDKAPLFARPQRYDPRVSALTLASKALFSKLGIWRHISEMRQCPYEEMRVWDAEGTGSVRFQANAVHQPDLGSIVENSVISSALYKGLTEQNNLTYLAPFNLAAVQRDEYGNPQIVSEDGSSICAKLLVAADGANSKIRQLASFATREWDYGHDAIVTTVQTEKAHQATAWQRFMPTGPLAFLPLGGDEEQRHCSIVWSVLTSEAERLMCLPEAQFNEALERAFESKLGRIECSDERFRVPLRQRHATEYFRDGIVLVGDAAHTIHPLAGQGVNLGFLDVIVLSEELHAGLKAGRRVNDKRILERYQCRRKPHNLQMMWAMEGFKHLFAGRTPATVWLRNFGLTQVDGFGPLKNLIARHALGME
tara:strand:- start:6138 stop:7553 length:1416 start_codon:yes stop_codon:yes gene_type:complete